MTLDTNDTFEMSRFSRHVPAIISVTFFVALEQSTFKLMMDVETYKATVNFVSLEMSFPLLFDLIQV